MIFRLGHGMFKLKRTQSCAGKDAHPNVGEQRITQLCASAFVYETKESYGKETGETTRDGHVQRVHSQEDAAVCFAGHVFQYVAAAF